MKKINRSDYQNIYISSDRHLMHKNILKYDEWRCFDSLDDMHEYIINTVLTTVWPSDLLVFAWDITLWNLDKVESIVSRLSEISMIWVLWNHDQKATVNRLSKYFLDVVDTLMIDDNIHINHYPPIDYNWEIRYLCDNRCTYIHWHSHKPWKKEYWYDISYDWSRLIYNLSDVIKTTE